MTELSAAVAHSLQARTGRHAITGPRDFDRTITNASGSSGTSPTNGSDPRERRHRRAPRDRRNTVDELLDCALRAMMGRRAWAGTGIYAWSEERTVEIS